MAANPTQNNKAFSDIDYTPSTTKFSGKYHSATVVAATTTGSFGAPGAAAFMLGAGADDAETKIFVAGGGGPIAGTEFAVEKIYDIAVTSVQSTGGITYVFKRNVG
jgi:hypothetical protein|tara:strand:+ start:830 stop:1147 length:318 start_codon:yes stop_codon:yes gene_type:complete